MTHVQPDAQDRSDAVADAGGPDTPRATPQVSDRVAALHARMSLEEKVAQLVGYWLDQGGDVVAPMQDEMAAGQAGTDRLGEITRHGIGHYTRVYGTRPVDPVHWRPRSTAFRARRWP